MEKMIPGWGSGLLLCSGTLTGNFAWGNPLGKCFVTETFQSPYGIQFGSRLLRNLKERGFLEIWLVESGVF